MPARVAEAAFVTDLALPPHGVATVRSTVRDITCIAFPALLTLALHHVTGVSQTTHTVA